MTEGIASSADNALDGKDDLAAHFDESARERARWRARNALYHRTVDDLVKREIPANAAVLVVGSSIGDLLPYIAADPRRSLGIDISPNMVRVARERHSLYRFEVADVETTDFALRDDVPQRFDYIVLQDVVGYLNDVESCLRQLRIFANPRARIIVTYYSHLWEPILKLGERVRLKMPQRTQNWLSMTDLHTMLRLAGWQVDTADATLIIPKPIPKVTQLVNSFAQRWPALKALALIQYFYGNLETPISETPDRSRTLTVSVIVPCRNERGNIQSVVTRIPKMGLRTEIIFVDGDSDDGTVEEICAAIQRFRGEKEIRLIHQVPQDAPELSEPMGEGLMLKLGKGDAVRKGFAAAEGDVVMILDSDLTVAPEELPKFFYPLAEGRASFMNGCRVVYPMEDQAMRFLNYVGNKMFSLIFSWLLGQNIKDTLCGTKALFKSDYLRIAENRAFFGEFDPFGDFDLLFGAAKLGLTIADVPIRYRARTSGTSKVTVFKHGLLLLHMTWIGFKRFKLRISAIG